MTKEQIEEVVRSNLIRYRQEQGLSQSEMARRLNTTPGFVCDFERGRRAPSLGTLAALAEVLGVTPAALVTPTDSGYAPPPPRRRRHAPAHT